MIPLGGAGEIGKNMYVVEHGGRMVLIDCGITFPKNDQMGVDIVLPDFTYVVERRDALEALILTHGHEDHIGAVPFLIRAVGQVPIYARRFTLALLRAKLDEHRLLEDAELVEVAYDQPLAVGPFRRRVHPAHAQTPDCAAVALRDRRRGRSCTRATSASSTPRSAAAAATCRPSRAWATGACGCCWPTPPTPRRAPTGRRSPCGT